MGAARPLPRHQNPRTEKPLPSQAGALCAYCVGVFLIWVINSIHRVDLALAENRVWSENNDHQNAPAHEYLLL